MYFGDSALISLREMGYFGDSALISLREMSALSPKYPGDTLQRMSIHPPADLASLDDALSAPTPALIRVLGSLHGDIIVLGAGGKMGPSLARMARRALDETDGGREREVIAVSRWSDATAAATLEAAGVRLIRADLLDRAAVEALPRADNVVFMAGQKFGTGGDPAQTWAMNAIVPAWCGEKFAGARQVVFSTGNVYPLTPASGPGASESTPLAPVGEYAMSCLARERIMTALGTRHASPAVLYRLNYACALTYGVLTDLAVKVRDGVPIDVTMGAVNVIWQGDANAIALMLLAHGGVPAVPVNVTGQGTYTVRALALALSDRLGRAPEFIGTEAPDALLSDARALVSRFGDNLPQLPLARLLDWTADWVGHSRPLLGKATKFEVRDGTF
ncbi:MAG: NAD(P)-dependent oxidoreductase [Gemmatimonadaceae bacterium]|nr:NAD(P)-dependent oxidoreductase [Gemmatimonadaceae bacterium]